MRVEIFKKIKSLNILSTRQTTNALRAMRGLNWVIRKYGQFSPDFGCNRVRKNFDLHFEQRGFKPDRFEDGIIRIRGDPLTFDVSRKLGDREWRGGVVKLHRKTIGVLLS